MREEEVKTPVKAKLITSIPHIHFDITQDEYGDYVVKGYIDEKLDYVNSSGNHRYALQAGKRWKKRILKKLRG